MKIASLLTLAIIPLVSPLQGETVSDLKSWTVEGPVEMDVAKKGPDGAPAIKIGPKAKASLKLRPEEGSGKVTLYVYDDATVAAPGKTRTVGPRWGLVQANGRVLLGAIMYAKFLQENGSVCLIDTDPAVKGAWAGMKFIATRGEPGWKKWEFAYDPAAGLKISLEGKELAAKQFDWNQSQATGFNGLVLYGDDSPGATPQTIWISGLSYELGGPMKVTPTSLAAGTSAPGSTSSSGAAAIPASAAPTNAATPSSQTPAAPPAPAAATPPPPPITQAEIDQATKGEPAKMTGFTPLPTLADDLKDMHVPLIANYGGKHPRLLFSPDDKASLQARAEKRPDLWNAVLTNAKSVKPAGSVPSEALIKGGEKYWAVERIESGALAWFMTGDPEYKEGVKRWMLAHAKEPVWGTAFRPNLDLVASWYLYHLAVGYDILWNELTDDERKVIRDGLIAHSRAIFADHDPADTKEKIRYDQNHTYIPIVALTAASLALLDEVPEARVWLNRSYAVLRRSRYVLGEDGCYHEGFGYWTYALHWQVRGAELLSRATGEKLFELPALRENWKNALYLSLPGLPGSFDIGDSGSWKVVPPAADKAGAPPVNQRANTGVTNSSMLWAIAGATGSPESQAAGDFYAARQAEADYPASAFLWYNPSVKAADLTTIAPYNYFADHGLVAWRSGWGADATAYLFRCGPSLGHKAMAKVGQLQDWTMNTGHVHPDIGAFWMFAKGTYLAVGTGYTGLKRTRDHNTFLVDDQGQGMDGSYHTERGVDYSLFDKAHIEREFLSNDYGFASGEFGAVYINTPGVTVRRNLLMTKRWLLLVDDLSGDRPHQFTWICHSDGEFKADGPAFIARQAQAGLAVVPIAPASLTPKMEPAIVAAGRGPGQETPTQRGWQLGLSLPQPAAKARMINLLAALGPEEKPPVVEVGKAEGNEIVLHLKWPDNKTEDVKLNLDWTGGKSGPAEIILN